MRQFSRVTSFGAMFAFLYWCIIDALSVRYAPHFDDVHGLEWPILAFPLLQAWYAFRALDRDLVRAILSSMFASFGALILFLFLGLPLHFTIGGTK